MVMDRAFCCSYFDSSATGAGAAAAGAGTNVTTVLMVRALISSW